MPDSPSADLPDRPGFVSQAVSETDSTEESEQENTQFPERNMTFWETDTPHLLRLQTREGDLEVLGMTYGDGTYFVLSHRESGNAVTGYDTDGTGVFAGVLETDFVSPVLLGFADGHMCLYSAEIDRTFACKTDSTYAWFNRGDTDSMQLYRGGYVQIKDGVVSFYGPQHQKAYTSYKIPDGMTFLLGDEEQALASQADGTLVQLDFTNEKMTQTELSPYLSCDGTGLSLSAEGQAVLLNPYDRTMIASSEHVRVLAAGNGYLVEERTYDIRFVRTSDGGVFTMLKDETFRFGARTDDGFLFATGGTWYLLGDEAFDDNGVAVLQSGEDAQLLDTAGQALCELASGNISLSADPAGFSAERVTDGETLFLAAAHLLSAVQNASLSDDTCIYLCDSVTVGEISVPYTLVEDGDVTNVLLDVSDAHYKEYLTEILTILQEGLTG